MIRSYSGGICTTNQRYWIGRIQVGNGYPQANAEFDGFIDEVAIYNKILTDEEVLEHYNEGK